MLSLRRGVGLAVLLFSAVFVSAQDSSFVVIDHTADEAGSLIRRIQVYSSEGEAAHLMMEDTQNSLIVSPDATRFMSSQSYGGADEFIYGTIQGQTLTHAIEIQDQLKGAVFRDDSQGLAFTWLNGFDSIWELEFRGMTETVSDYRFRGELESFDEIDGIPPFTFYGAPRVVQWVGDRAFIVPAGQNWINESELFVLDLSTIKSQPILRGVQSVLQPLYEQYPQYFVDLPRFQGAKAVPGILSSWELSVDGQFLAVPYVDSTLCDPTCFEGWSNAVVVFDLESDTVVTSFATEAEGPVISLQWSEDGQQIAYVTGAVTRDRTIPLQLRIFDARTGEQSTPLPLTNESDTGLWILDQALCGSTYFYALGDGMDTMRLYSVDITEMASPVQISTGAQISIVTCIKSPE